MPIASGIERSSTSPRREQAVDQVSRGRVRPDLPRARRAALRLQLRVNLVPDDLDLVGAQTKALRDVPARLVAPHHPEHVAVCRRRARPCGPSGVYVLAFSASSSISVVITAVPARCPPCLPVDVLEVLDLLRVLRVSGKLNLLAVRAPAVDVALARVVGGEDEPLAVVLP